MGTLLTFNLNQSISLFPHLLQHPLTLLLQCPLFKCKEFAQPSQSMFQDSFGFCVPQTIIQLFWLHQHKSEVHALLHFFWNQNEFTFYFVQVYEGADKGYQKLKSKSQKMHTSGKIYSRRAFWKKVGSDFGIPRLDQGNWYWHWEILQWKEYEEYVSEIFSYWSFISSLY